MSKFEEHEAVTSALHLRGAEPKLSFDECLALCALDEFGGKTPKQSLSLFDVRNIDTTLSLM
jgi:hypothetical protein